MSDPQENNAPDERMPATDEIEEPSTEKDPGEEPEAPAPAEPDVDHEAVGIGVVGRPQVDPDSVDD